MRVALGVLALVAAACAYDSVIFSSEQELSRDHPSIDALVSGASVEHPLVFLVEPDFTLGQFSRQAAAYTGDQKQASPLASIVRSAKHSAQRYVDVTVHVPSAVVATSADGFKSGSAVYILAADDWASLEILASSILPQLSGYTGVLASTESVSQNAARVKRLTSDLLEEGDDTAAASQAQPQKQQSEAAGVDVRLPLSLPPHNRTGVTTKSTGQCLLYMEGVNILVTLKKGEVPSGWPSAGATIVNGTFKADDSNVQCIASNSSAGITTFTVSVTPDDNAVGHNVEGVQFQVAKQPISFKLSFVSDNVGYWSLATVELLSDLAVEPASNSKGSILSAATSAKAKSEAKGLSYMGIYAVLGYAFNCGDTPAAWFEAEDKNHLIGLSFHNMQVALGGVDPVKGHYFNLQVGDCVGTFSTGSLMGIITSLILVTVFLFGFLMLNSVQTMDRFDDPKQKQIIINVRE